MVIKKLMLLTLKTDDTHKYVYLTHNMYVQNPINVERKKSNASKCFQHPEMWETF